jgi:hypothetical protein
MIKTFASDGADQPFRMSILPWRVRRGRPVANAHRMKTPFEYLAVDAVAYDIPRCVFLAAGLGKFSGDSFSRRPHRHRVKSGAAS